MKKQMIIIALTTLVLITGCKKKNAADADLSQNPFLQTWDTPYEVPLFDKIKPEHYLPAFHEGMRQQNEEIAAICNNSEKATFENTIEALEYSGALLTKVGNVFFNLAAACNSDEMMAIADSITPLLSAHSDEISLNKVLFNKIKSVYDEKEQLNLDAAQSRLLELTYKEYIRNGAGIPESQQERFKQINQELASLSLKFENNVLTATNRYSLVLDPSDPRIIDMPEGVIAAALQTGNQNENTKGKCVFLLQIPSWEPFMQNCSDRELREEMWNAYANRCTSDSTDNREIINQIVNLRLERAKILGFSSHAAYVLDDVMAKTPEAVNDLLMKVWTPALAKAKEEASWYEKMLKKDDKNASLQPYDWRYYAEKLRQDKYALNDAEVLPYFSLENVRKGAFMVAEKLYGITFEKTDAIPVYHPEVEVFEVKENGEVIAILYFDYYPRESKASGAWMTNFREQYYTQSGEKVIPLVSLVLNSTKPTGDTPSLLNFDQTETLFHEFGHGLHGILTNCKYASLSGTNVARDFVEFPSQFMENWASDPEVMKMYAFHYKTGEVIPDELIQKIVRSRTYGHGFINTELIAASLLDMAYHNITKPQQIVASDFENREMAEIGLIPSIISRYKSPYFKHIFSGGYSSGYYSYTWSAVFDNDAFAAFKEKKNLFDPECAKSLRTNVLEKGNMEEPMTLYINFRGKEPSIAYMLAKRGLLVPTTMD